MKPYKRIATSLGEILLGLGGIYISRVIPNFVFEDKEKIYVTLPDRYFEMDIYLKSDPLLFWCFTILFFGLGVWLFFEGFLKLSNYRKTSKQET